MRTISRFLIGPLVFTFSVATSGFAQERHAVAPADLAKTVAQFSTKQDVDRAAVREALGRPEVRAMADRLGVNVEQIGASVDGLSPEELGRVAASARDVNEALVGGASTITISTTTIILVLLVVILILVAD